jgi:hypothetical protein
MIEYNNLHIYDFKKIKNINKDRNLRIKKRNSMINILNFACVYKKHMIY